MRPNGNIWAQNMESLDANKEFLKLLSMPRKSQGYLWDGRKIEIAHGGGICYHTKQCKGALVYFVLTKLVLFILIYIFIPNIKVNSDSAIRHVLLSKIPSRTSFNFPVCEMYLWLMLIRVRTTRFQPWYEACFQCVMEQMTWSLNKCSGDKSSRWLHNNLWTR